MKRKMIVGGTYQIAFMDNCQPSYTWYNGPAIFIRTSEEDFGTNEQYLIFKIPGDDNECTFPESSVGARIDKH